jgi:hypothetical protein
VGYSAVLPNGGLKRANPPKGSGFAAYPVLTECAAVGDDAMRFKPSPELIERLRQHKPGGVADEVMSEHNAFVLDLGMGPAFYLRLDGQIFVDERWWDGEKVREATEDESVCGLVCGAHKTGIQELLDLIPLPPPEGKPCQRCNGSRWASSPAKDDEGNEIRFVCPRCWGRGWHVEQEDAPDERRFGQRKSSARS